MDNRLSAGLKRQRLFFGCLLTGLLLCWGMSPLHAQDAASGGVSGIVRNEQGDPLSGITVVATNLSTHLTAGTMTDTTSGFSIFRNCLPTANTASLSAVLDSSRKR
jgi:hypothetical protein